MANPEESKPIFIDQNSDDFYEKVQEEIELDLARAKMNIDVISLQRLTAVEIEVETVALYHSELFLNIQQLASIEDYINEGMSSLGSSK